MSGKNTIFGKYIWNEVTRENAKTRKKEAPEM